MWAASMTPLVNLCYYQLLVHLDLAVGPSHVLLVLLPYSIRKGYIAWLRLGFHTTICFIEDCASWTKCKTETVAKNSKPYPSPSGIPLQSVILSPGCTGPLNGILSCTIYRLRPWSLILIQLEVVFSDTIPHSLKKEKLVCMVKRSVPWHPFNWYYEKKLLWAFWQNLGGTNDKHPICVNIPLRHGLGLSMTHHMLMLWLVRNVACIEARKIRPTSKWEYKLPLVGRPVELGSIHGRVQSIFLLFYSLCPIMTFS